MRTLHHYAVRPRLPARLQPLLGIAENLFWAWNTPARDLFVRMDPDLWEELHGNPILLLSRVSQARLLELAEDDAFLSHMQGVRDALAKYMAREGWFARAFPEAAGARIAYFSMEYGLHESLPIYSGGLGVLAGDHLKTASDLGLPLVGIGLAYAEGYFRQVLAPDGLQGEHYPENDWHKLPVHPVMGADGKRLKIRVAYPGHDVLSQLWRVQVGRVPLFLLDANVEENAPNDRAITGPLYGGDQEFRVRQEIMLGIGGIHALEALGLTPTVCHMNEGHSAFMALERIARVVREKNVSFQVAREACSAGNIFTTHTPVPAGNDAFDPDVVARYLEPYREALGISASELLALGRPEREPSRAHFSMPVLAMQSAARSNAVSKLHGRVAREMWKPLWPEVPAHEVPIGSVTNGIHAPTWIPQEIGALYTRYLGPRWPEAMDDRELWARAESIPDAELWEVHEHRRHRLIARTRRWLGRAESRRGNSPDPSLEEVLDPRALTLGFARRFATYKRATLLFSDMDRVKRLLLNPKRPVQLVFAGKAHPQDRGGKELIRRIVQASRDPDLHGRVVFIEDYDMSIARALVSGVDVWLNTPRRPLEASGTSGMKAAANGALAVSVLDGWFAEAWSTHGPDIGWAVGRGEEYPDAEGDLVEAEALYDVLEREVVPLFFDRETRSSLPRAWIRKMKRTISKLVPEYSTSRMVKEYTADLYVPSIARSRSMAAANLQGAKDAALFRERIGAAWSGVRIEAVEFPKDLELCVGDTLRVTATVLLGALGPGDVSVEVYYGPTEGAQTLSMGSALRMAHQAELGQGRHAYAADVTISESGAQALAVRVVPYHAEREITDLALMRWG